MELPRTQPRHSSAGGVHALRHRPTHAGAPDPAPAVQRCATAVGRRDCGSLAAAPPADRGRHLPGRTHGVACRPVLPADVVRVHPRDRGDHGTTDHGPRDHRSKKSRSPWSMVPWSRVGSERVVGLSPASWPACWAWPPRRSWSRRRCWCSCTTGRLSPGLFREAWRQRRGCHVALASTWALLGLLALGTHGTAGALPVFSRGWPRSSTCCRNSRDRRLPQALLLAAPAGVRLWSGWVIRRFAAVWRAGRDARHACWSAATRWRCGVAPVAGFVGAWFFATLAPSSSIVPMARRR